MSIHIHSAQPVTLTAQTHRCRRRHPFSKSCILRRLVTILPSHQWPLLERGWHGQTTMSANSSKSQQWWWRLDVLLILKVNPPARNFSAAGAECKLQGHHGSSHHHYLHCSFGFVSSAHDMGKVGVVFFATIKFVGIIIYCCVPNQVCSAGKHNSCEATVVPPITYTITHLHVGIWVA